MTTIEINKQDRDEYELSEQEQSFLIQHLKEQRTRYENETSSARKRREEVIRAYHCQHDEEFIRRKRSRGFLPWAYTAISTGHARLLSSLLPNDEDVFALDPETPDDQPGCEMMSEFIKYTLKDMSFEGLMDDAIKQLLFGGAVIKLNWRKDYAVETTAMSIGPDGTIRGGEKEEISKYNNAYAELIDYDDFMIYPLAGDQTRVIQGHRVWRFKDELEESAEINGYQGIEELQDRKENYEYRREGDSNQAGVEVWEYWISRINIEGRIFKDMIATIADDKVVLRFVPNDNDYGLKPFIYATLMKTISETGGIQNTGQGLVDKAFELLKVGNFTLNQILDESKVKLHGFYKYTHDGVFSPSKFVSRPGGLVRVGDLNNLQPINPNINQLSFGIAELEYLKNEFEEATMVPQFLKGTEGGDPNETATAKRLAAAGSDTNFRYLGKRANDNLLEPFIKMLYCLIRQMAMTDYDVLYQIARVTKKHTVQEMDPATGQPATRELSPEELIRQLPVIPPLSKIDVKVVGFENVLDKMDRANQLERAIGMVTQFTEGDESLQLWLKKEQILKSYFQYMKIDSDLIRTDEEHAEVIAQIQQARQMAMQQQQEQMERDSRAQTVARIRDKYLNAA